MKLQQSFSFFLAVSAFSHQLSSVLVHAKKHSIKGHDRHLTNEDSTFALAPALTSTSHSKIVHGLLPTIAEKKETTASSQAVLPSASSPLLRRGLKGGEADFLFQDCSEICMKNGGAATKYDGGCCKGGVSYLKVVFEAEADIRGTMTLDASQAEAFTADDSESTKCGLSQYQANTGSKGTKGTKGGFLPNTSSQSSSFSHTALRIVDCEQSCIQEPFSGKDCEGGVYLSKTDVKSGDEVCFAMVTFDDSNGAKIAFDQRMPTDMYVWFLSGGGQVLMGAIHTSCSVPLSQPWGVPLNNVRPDGCDDGNKVNARDSHMEIGDEFAFSTPHLSFIDGISTKYFDAVKTVLDPEDAESYAQDMSIGFENCGCTCESFSGNFGTDAPSIGPNLTPSPSADPSSPQGLISTPTTDPPTADPSSAPTEGLTSAPTTDPSSAPTEEPSANPTSDPSSVPTEGLTSSPTTDPSSALTESPTSFSTPTETSDDGNAGPGSPSSSTPNPSCSSTCVQYILESCVFAGTAIACDINAGAPISTDDDADESEGAIDATLPPSATLPPNAPDGTGKSGKGAKGKSGAGKSGKTAEKSTDFGKGKAGGKSGDKLEKTASKSGSKAEKSRGKSGKGGQYYYFNSSNAEKSKGKSGKGGQYYYFNSSNAEKSKGKGGKGGQYYFNSGNERHLQQIEYHQSRIEYFKELLMHAEN